MKQKLYDITANGEIADHLGNLRAEIKRLKEAQKFFEDILKNNHVTEAEGEKYRVTISYSVERKTTDWQSVAEKFKPSYQLIAAHKKVSVYDSVKVTAHTK